MLSLLPKFSTLPSLVAISLVKVKTQVFQWHLMYHWSRDQRVVSLGVGVSHNISAPCVVWCPCVFSKWIYNASILQHNLRRPPHLGVKQIYGWKLLVCHDPDLKPTRQNYVPRTSWGLRQKRSYGRPLMVLYVTPRDVPYWHPEVVFYRRP